MARWCEELLGRESLVGDGAIVMVLAETRLRFPLNAREIVPVEVHSATILVGMTESPNERASLGSLARTLTIGRSEARLVSEDDWVDCVMQELLSRPEVECNLIFAARVASPAFAHQMEMLLSRTQAGGVNVGISTLVTEQANAPLSISGVHGLIAAQADWVQTATTVFHMLASLMAPFQHTCLDLLDLRSVFEAGRPTRVIEVIASKSSELLFASKDDEKAFGQADRLAVFLWRNRPGTLSDGWNAVGRVRESAGPKACLVVSFSDEFLTPSWKPLDFSKLVLLVG